MVAGPSLDRHHWVPRAEGGRDRAWVHLVCHRMVHRLFADHSRTAHFLYVSIRVGNDPVAAQQLHRFIALVRDADGVIEEPLTLEGL